MVTTVGLNLAEADRLVKAAFPAGWTGYDAKYDKVFIIEEPQRYDEKFTILKTNSAVSEVQDGGAYPTQSINELGTNTITSRVYKSALPISDLTEAFTEANYGRISEIAKVRGYHFKQKIDSLAVSFLNNGTSTTSPYGINVAGTTTSLFLATQPIGDSGATQSNRISGNLDKTTLNSARTALRKMKDHDGMVVGYQPKRLVVPEEEAMNAWQISVSKGEPESANRNDNYIETLGLEIIPWQLLSSTTACFLLAAKDDFGAKGLRLEVKELPSTRRIMNPFTGNWTYQFRMILFPGVVDYQGAVSIGL